MITETELLTFQVQVLNSVKEVAASTNSSVQMRVAVSLYKLLSALAETLHAVSAIERGRLALEKLRAIQQVSGIKDPMFEGLMASIYREFGEESESASSFEEEEEEGEEITSGEDWVNALKSKRGSEGAS